MTPGQDRQCQDLEGDLGECAVEETGTDESPKEVDATALAEAMLVQLEVSQEKMKMADPLAFAVATKPGANVVNGGRKRAEAESLRSAYDKHKRRMKRDNPRFKMGRYTQPKPKGKQ